MTPPAFTVLVTDPNGRASTSSGRARLAEREPDVRVGRPVILAGGTAAFLPLAYTGKTSDSIDEATRLRHCSSTPHTRVIGEPAIWSNFQTVSKQQLKRGESIGFPLILLILLAGFGTVAAAVAPVALGAVTVFLSGAVIYWLSRSFTISVYVTNMASMIGIGVAVDYSLFIVSRFRRELHEGATQDERACGARWPARDGGRLQRRDRRGLARRALRDRRQRASLDGGRRDRRRLHLGARVGHAAARTARRGGNTHRPVRGCGCRGGRARKGATRCGRRWAARSHAAAGGRRSSAAPR